MIILQVGDRVRRALTPEGTERRYHVRRGGSIAIVPRSLITIDPQRHRKCECGIVYAVEPGRPLESVEHGEKLLDGHKRGHHSRAFLNARPA